METEPVPIVIQRYTEPEKIKAVATYVALGRLTAVATELGIGYDTLKYWKKQEWWKQYERQIKNEENAHLSSRFRKIVNKVQEEILDRVDSGDHVVLKDGSVIRVPVKARDLAVIGAIAVDKVVKLDESLEEKGDDIGVEQRLKMLAKELVELAKGKNAKTPITIDIEEVEPDAEFKEVQA